MNSPIKLISTDFDGTIFAEFEKPPIAPRLVELIAGLQAQGVKWVINTGREMASLLEVLARSQIEIQPDYLVLVEREIYEHNGIRYKAHPEWNAACAHDHEELFKETRPHVPSLMDWVNARFKATVYEDAYSPFCLIAGNNADADQIHAKMEEFCGQFSNLTVVRNDVYARFSHKAYNKGKALAELRRLLGITEKEVLAAGDHLNDLPMLKLEHASWLVAPQNAIPIVKQVVAGQGGFVSALPFGNGVAEGLRRHLETAK